MNCMKRSFTQLDLIKYLYAELDEDSSMAILEWILSDEKRSQRFEDLAESKKQLYSESISPSESSLRKILAYSEGLSLEAHR